MDRQASGINLLTYSSTRKEMCIFPKVLNYSFKGLHIIQIADKGRVNDGLKICKRNQAIQLFSTFFHLNGDLVKLSVSVLLTRSKLYRHLEVLYKYIHTGVGHEF